MMCDANKADPQRDGLYSKGDRFSLISLFRSVSSASPDSNVDRPDGCRPRPITSTSALGVWQLRVWSSATPHSCSEVLEGVAYLGGRAQGDVGRACGKGFALSISDILYRDCLKPGLTL